ncbi:HAD family hydrolase [Algiphilus sp.]|uniref:HAD family hydrolase n=1 Tax=Algiphilus sp. TaxID=1872431 RepID=UPI0025BA6EDB|nr:HAD family hydrolase [Algiphilus sp.]MCK5771918.1 haloacid dehalogenase-like hydrolase [Algiphilus sp.]
MQETIAIVFDFDDTLAPDTTTGFLDWAGIGDVGAFWAEDVAPLITEGWDPVPAYMFAMIEAARAGRCRPLTRESFAEWGAIAPLHRGVPELFAHLRAAAHSENPRAQLEFYVISSGIGDVLRATGIADAFTAIWSSEFAYGADDAARFARRVVSFTDKTRYLFHVQKGLIGAEADRNPFAVNRRIPAERLRVPLANMIFVGDGYTDIPCFSLLEQNGGTPIAVYDPQRPDKWRRAFDFVREGRVRTLHSANYEAGSDLNNVLTMATAAIAADLEQRTR